jgi:hypothetical protein
MIPRFPFRRNNFVADDYLLFFFPSAFNFDFFSLSLKNAITILVSMSAFMPTQKSPPRSRLEFLRA